MSKGFVALVGAGPGNKGLLTVRGAELIQRAEVIVYDRLVSKDILNMIPETAEMINVGKESSHHLVKQEDINKILLEEAKKGKYVVRLKGGDPFVFGRGGEELELLAENNIAFEVVPGITSGISALAYAGIPITHRDFCSSLHIITGHAREGGKLDIPFEELVGLRGTLVFLMGVSSMSFLMEGLIKAGMNPNTKAAVVENGTRPNQRKIVATISTLVEVATKEKIHSPAIIAVGEVCSLSESFDWFMNRALFGQRVIVTRPKHSLGTLSDKLKELGAEVIEYPCIETLEIEAELPEVNEYDVVTFSSKTSVEIFFNKLFEAGKDVRALGNVKIGAVGSQTAAELKKYGIVADLVPDIFDGEHLGKMVTESIKPDEKVLVLNALKTSGDLEQILQSAGVEYKAVPLYDTVYTNPDSEEVRKQIEAHDGNWVMFTSASTVHGFVKSMEDLNIENIKALCIGEQTLKAAKEYGLNCEVSEKATIASMIDKLIELS